MGTLIGLLSEARDQCEPMIRHVGQLILQDVGQQNVVLSLKRLFDL
ncbi:MAG: hypothetical protein IID38_08700 [Planctomycetes bacterium]|nr:hypothetical protein [Planctomycetota bacterium]